MKFARHPVLVLAVLFGVLAMHGGIGISNCSQMSMSSSATAADDMTMAADMPMSDAATGGLVTSMALHHTPVVPSGPVDSHMKDNCAAPLPPSGVLVALALILLGAYCAQSSLLRPWQRSPRPSGREPPRPRWRDPVIGLGVLRT